MHSIISHLRSRLGHACGCALLNAISPSKPLRAQTAAAGAYISADARLDHYFGEACARFVPLAHRAFSAKDRPSQDSDVLDGKPVASLATGGSARRPRGLPLCGDGSLTGRHDLGHAIEPGGARHFLDVGPAPMPRLPERFWSDVEPDFMG